MNSTQEAKSATISDFLRWEPFSALYESFKHSELAQGLHQWKSQNPHVWRLTSLFFEEFVRRKTRNLLADVLQRSILIAPLRVPFLDAIATRYDRRLFDGLNQYFLTTSWISRYFLWAFNRMFPDEELANTEESFPAKGFRFPSFLEVHLLGSVSEFLSGEFILPLAGRWVPLLDFRSPFPSRTVSASYFTLSIAARGVGQLPGMLLDWPSLAHWGELISFTLLNAVYVAKFVYPSIAGGDNADLANRSFKDTDLYRALDVQPNASTTDILRAYKKKSLEFHPDRNIHRTHNERQCAQETFKVVNEAKRILSDPRARFIYDQSLCTGESAPTGPMFDAEVFAGQQPEDVEQFFRKFFSERMRFASFTELKKDPLQCLATVFPPFCAVSASALILLPFCVHLNISYWQHTAADSGSLLLRVMQRFLASTLL